MKNVKILEIKELQKRQAYLKSMSRLFVILLAQKINVIRCGLTQIPGLKLKSNYSMHNRFLQLIKKK